MDGNPQGGMKSEAGRAAYWRMQHESAIGALADLIAEHTETVDEVERLTTIAGSAQRMLDDIEGRVTLVPLPDRDALHDVIRANITAREVHDIEGPVTVHCRTAAVTDAVLAFLKGES